MNNHFLDGELVKRSEIVNSLDIQGNGAIEDISKSRHYTITNVNDSATSAQADTPLTRFCSSPVLNSQGEAA